MALFSFYYTSKTSTVIKDTDEIMIKIKEVENTLPTNAVINDNFVIPGISGLEVDISKSYDVMKKVGVFSSNMLVFKKIKPDVSISKIYDKYINSGNPKNNKVSLIFKVDSDDDILTVLNILDKYEVKASFFANDILTDEMLSLTKNGHNVGIVTNETWVNTLVSKNQKSSYCYLEEENKETLNMCSMNKLHTIMPSIKAFKTPALSIKKNLKPGSIISLEINKQTIKELEFIIRFIKSKGLDLVNLDTLLAE